MREQILKLPFLFGVGGAVYYSIEIICRGFSHWTMFVLGGLCFVIIGLLDKALRTTCSYPQLMILSSLIITALELVTGIIVNKWLGLQIWDYSGQPFNFMGQICLLFSVIWFFLSYIAILLDNFLRCWFFHEERPTIHLPFK